METRVATVASGWALRAATTTPKRFMGTTGKGANRAAVQGARTPATTSIDIEEVEEEINKGKEVKEKKTKEVEDRVDSELKKTTEK